MVGQHCYFCHGPLRPSAHYCPGCGQPLLLRTRYRLTRTLGQGGYGVVYEATDTQLHNRRCAIKVVSSVSRAGQQQVEAEARILSGYASQFPFVPHIYDHWSEQARTYLVMEYIDGPTLEETLAQPWPAAEVQGFLLTLLDHLAQLHAAGIVHRDLKPANIKRTPQGRYVLLDFGIAKQGSATLPAAKALALDYGSPEQLRGQPTDARSDLYSLAATAYHLLTGRPPTPVHMRLAAQAPLTSPHQLVPGVPPGLGTALLRMLELDQAARPVDAHAARALLQLPAQVAIKVPLPLPTASSLAAWAAKARRPAPPTRQGTGASVRVLDGHTGPVRSVSFSPDGTILASGSYDRTVRLWQVHSPAPPRTLRGHSVTVRSVAFSPDGTIVASGSYDHTARLWRAADGRIISTFQEQSGVRSVAFSPDGAVLASGLSEGAVHLWDVNHAVSLRILTGHACPLNGVAFSPDGGTVASASHDGTVRLWRAGDGMLLRTVYERAGVSSLAFSPDGEMLAFGAYDGTVRLWDVRHGTALRTLDGYTKAPQPSSGRGRPAAPVIEVSCVAFSPDGAILASGSDDHSVRLWRTADGTLLRTLVGHAGPVLGVAFSPDGVTLASGSGDRTIRLWQVH